VSSSYLTRAERLELSDAAKGQQQEFEDVLFVNQRFDNQCLKGKTFKHCTFANVSFLRSKLRDCTFLDCVFLDCYFRLAEIGSKFPASRFLSCDFARSRLVDGADFQDYTYWQNCYITYDEIQDKLPSRLNIRVRLANNLAQETQNAGATRDARKFRLLAIEAWEQHCVKIFQARDSSYQKKYTNRRWDGAFSYLKSRAQGLVWGYGERARVPIIMSILIALVFYPALFWVFNAGLARQDGAHLIFWDYVLRSVQNVLPGSGISEVSFTTLTTQLLAASEILVGLLYAGVFVALLLKAGERR